MCVCACGCVHDKLAQYTFILLQSCTPHPKELDELCSFSGSLPCVLILTKLLYVTLHVGKQNMID